MQWIVVVIAVAVLCAMSLLEIVDHFASEGRGMPMDIPAGVVAMLAQAMWITMDRKRLGLEMGWWRFAAILVGPLAIWMHLLMNYGLRALWLVPLSMVPYLVLLGFTFAAWAIADQLHGPM